MLAQLRMARADQTYDRKLLRFTTPDLLIVDDLGLRPLVHDEPLVARNISPKDAAGWFEHSGVLRAHPV